MMKLKRCPFCGGEARLQRKQKTGHGYYVICKKCGCRTPLFQYQFDSKEILREEAIKTWNTRKPVEDVLEHLEEELNFADIEKKRCAKENLLQFDSAKGCAQGLYNAIKIIKEELGGMTDV